MADWEVIYRRAMEDDGTLFFKERLDKEFLEQIKRSMGSYLFANQYQNIIIPDEEKVFKKEWLKYYGDLPSIVSNYAFIDPAIGQRDHSDYTGLAIISVSTTGTWYLIHAERYRWTPTQIVSKMFELSKQYTLQAIGIEVVAYQEALLYFLHQEMVKRNIYLPVYGVTRKAISKQTRILGLVPRFEWGGLYVNHGMLNFEDEYSSFPRGEHDDIFDALASLDELISIPSVKEKKLDGPISPLDPKYESFYIKNLVERRNRQITEGEFD